MNNRTGGILRPYAVELMWAARVLDGCLIAATLWVCVYAYGHEWQPHHTLATLAAVLLFYLAAEIARLYHSWRTFPIREEFSCLMGVLVAAVIGIMILGYATKTTQQYSRLAFGTWVLLTPAVLMSWRIVARGVFRYFRVHGHNTRTAAIVGTGTVAKEIASTLEGSPWMGLKLLGFYTDRAEELELTGDETSEPAPRSTTALIEAIRHSRVDVVYIALPMSEEKRINQLVDELSDTTTSIYVIPDSFVFRLAHAQWVYVGDIPAVSVLETPFFGLLGGLKRLEDVVVATSALLLLGLPMCLIAMAIKLGSPGPALFKQRRYGLDGREIEVWKFRTMTVCESDDQFKQATRNDPRITALGAFLRRTSLDELPQLFNVLQGAMSVVGPRPLPVKLNEQFRRRIQGFMLRHKVKPGITGWAQANGWRGETDTWEKMERRIEHDLWYIRNWTPWLDVRIMALTIARGLRSENAY